MVWRVILAPWSSVAASSCPKIVEDARPLARNVSFIPSLLGPERERGNEEAISPTNQLENLASPWPQTQPSSSKAVQDWVSILSCLVLYNQYNSPKADRQTMAESNKQEALRKLMLLSTSLASPPPLHFSVAEEKLEWDYLCQRARAAVASLLASESGDRSSRRSKGTRTTILIAPI